MTKIKNDFDYNTAVLGLKKVLAQTNINDVFKYREDLVNYQRFCHDEESVREMFRLSDVEKERVKDLELENDLNRLEGIFFERYPYLI